MDDAVRTVELGQFERDNAMAIGRRLDAAGVVWWHKAPGPFTQLLSAADWGVRLFVDVHRVEEARRIAAETLDPDLDGPEADDVG